MKILKTSTILKFYLPNFLRLNQHLIHLFYVSRYITFSYAFGHTSAPSSWSQMQCNVTCTIGVLHIGLSENNMTVIHKMRNIKIIPTKF